MQFCGSSAEYSGSDFALVRVGMIRLWRPAQDLVN